MACRDGQQAALEVLEKRLRDGLDSALRPATEDERLALVSQPATPAFVAFAELATRVLQARQLAGQPSRGTLAAALLGNPAVTPQERLSQLKAILGIH